jgi:DNA polymerase elongation subunit (family B)
LENFWEGSTDLLPLQANDVHTTIRVLPELRTGNALPQFRRGARTGSLRVLAVCARNLVRRENAIQQLNVEIQNSSTNCLCKSALKHSFISMEVYTYSWHLRERENECRVVAYGISKDGQNVQLGFQFWPRCYISLPASVDWTDDKRKQLRAALKKKLLTDQYVFVEMPQLFGGGRDVCGEWKKFPFLYCAFKTRQSMFFSERNLDKIYLSFLGRLVSLKFHETRVQSIVQAVTGRQLDFTGWCLVPENAVESVGKRTFGCLEMAITHNDISRVPEQRAAPPFLVMSFDLETYSDDWLKFPNADVPEDCIFQISCIFKWTGSKTSEKILLCQLVCDPIENVEVRLFANEYKLITGFVNLVTEKNPHILIGYNIMKFDLPYLIKRATLLRCRNEFDILGFPKFLPGVVTEKKWSSSAYRDQCYHFLDIEGRIYVDLNPFVEKNFKLENYKLSTVAKTFLKDDKMDMDARTMFKSFELAVAGNEGGGEAMAEVGKYCVHDSALVLELFDRLQVWSSLVEMSKIVHCPISDILLRGQQIRVFNSIVKLCFKKMVIVKPSVEWASGKYVGAYVFDPVPGMYENVVPFDFASLYPSTIIAYNIDYCTLVTDESVPDSDCNIFEWEDHVSCEHDPKVIRLADETIDKREKASLKKKLLKNVICAKRRFRFLKSPDGVLPTIIKNCLTARKDTRALLASMSKNDPDWAVLNQRQIAYKVSANSMYGFTGIGEKGMLSCLPLAMCITQKGRENVKLAADEMTKRYGALVVYGDTDSNYVTFPNLLHPAQVWDMGLKAASEISALFPQPMELEFEETIYRQFLILAKKKYVFQKMDKNGIIENSIGKIGVVLNRRDNCKFIRDVYELLVNLVFENGNKNVSHCSGKCVCENCIIYQICQRINDLDTGMVSIDDLTMTKGCRDFGEDDEPEDDRMGAYKVKRLPEEPEAKMKKLNKKTEKEFYASQLPAVAQLKKRMERRGLPVTEGSRVEFVVARYGGAKQGDNIESVEYFKEFKHVLKIDSFYYLNLLINPIDQILETCFHTRDVIKNFVQIKVQKLKVVESICKLFAARWPNENLKVVKSVIRIGSLKVKTYSLKNV